MQRGDQGKFFKNRPKRKSRLKGRKALLSKGYYTLIIMHLRAKTGDDFDANSGFKSARMAKLWQFSQGHPKPAFSVKEQSGDQGKFLKIAQKIALVWKAQKHTGANSGSKRAWMAKLWQFSRGHPKPAFLEKVQRGDQGKFFKNRPKSKPRLKSRKALLRKYYYPEIIMHLRF